MPTQPAYWFPAKRYGWGWGPPNTWQGWLVMALFAILLAAGSWKLLPAYGPPVFVAYSLVLSSILVAVCWIKGEPPAWRWGRKSP